MANIRLLQLLKCRTSDFRRVCAIYFLKHSLTVKFYLISIMVNIFWSSSFCVHKSSYSHSPVTSTANLESLVWKCNQESQSSRLDSFMVVMNKHRSKGQVMGVMTPSKPKNIYIDQNISLNIQMRYNCFLCYRFKILIFLIH